MKHHALQVEVREWKDFTPALNAKNMILAPVCADKEVEVNIKKRSAEVWIAASQQGQASGSTS